MRMLLLLSALLTAFAGTGAHARAAGVPAQQVASLVEVVAARRAVATGGLRPVAEQPFVRKIAAPLVGETPLALKAPLYAERLRV